MPKLMRSTKCEASIFGEPSWPLKMPALFWRYDQIQFLSFGLDGQKNERQRRSQVNW